MSHPINDMGYLWDIYGTSMGYLWDNLKEVMERWYRAGCEKVRKINWLSGLLWI